jgi:positive regulator of sigma E activity
LFRRTKPEQTAAESTVLKEGGKGRPTPSRREAEAAARARAKAGMDKKAASKLLRERRTEQNARMREGLRTGEEKYLPARDQGRVKRFERDYIDARICMAEFLLPLLIVIMVTQTFAQAFSNGLWSATILLVVLDTVWLVFRLKREIKRRFPDESTKGTTTYALLRSLQLRWLRLPKPQVKVGQKLPERY